jgi:Cu+-exporting ATPase
MAMTSITLSIPDMKCDGCAKAVESALAKLDWVKRADVSLDSKTVTVELDAGGPEEMLVEAIKAAGYSASPTN